MNVDRSPSTETECVSGPAPRPSGRGAAAWICAIVLVGAALYWTKSIAVPLTIAFMGYLVLRPIVCRLVGWGLPATPAAIGLMVVLAGILIGGGVLMLVPAKKWIAEAPENVRRVQAQLREIGPLAVIDNAGAKMDQLATDRDRPTEVTVEQPQLMDESTVISTTGRLAAIAAVVFVTTLFLLTTGDDLLERVLTVIPDDRDRRRLVDTMSELQNSIGEYLGNITMINIGLGFATATVTWAYGMPTPYLWGAMATVCNFIPYVGPVAASGLTTVAAISHFDSLPWGLLVGGSYWLTTAIEGQFVTPGIIGNRMRIGPVVVLVTVAFWGWLWGLAGILLAVPMAIAARIVASQFETTRPLAYVLGEDLPEVEHRQVELSEDQPLCEAA